MLEAWRRWAEIERGLSPATLVAYEREIRLLPEPRESLQASELRAVLYGRSGKPSTIARRLAAWSSFYGFLVRTQVRVDDPTALLDRPKVAQGLPRPVSGIHDKLAALEPPFTHIAVLLVETGLRIAEAKALDVELPVPLELIVTGKGSRTRIVPLTQAAQDALTELGGRIEPSTRTIQRRFAAVGFTPHKLRHTLASALIAAGADLGEVQDILGHASPATTRVYAAYRTDRLRAALERRGAPGPGAVG